MWKKGFLLASLSLLALFALPRCSRLKYDVIPDAGSRYHSMKIKATVRDRVDGKARTMKVLVKFNEKRTRMLFLGPPLNRIYAKLLVEEEKALLVNARKKKYWQGDFSTLLRRIWDLDFQYREFQKLLLEGTFPGKKAGKQGLKISVKHNKNGGAPSVIDVMGRELVLNFKISNRKTLAGKLQVSENLAGMRPGDIEAVLTEDDE